MLLATKGNREVKISPDDKEKYLDAGYSLLEKKQDGSVERLIVHEKKSAAMIALEKENAELREKLATAEIEKIEEEPKTPAKGKGK